MALLFPAIILGIGLLVAVTMYWLDAEYHGERLGIFMIFVAVLAPLASMAYGLYGWLRHGAWDSISVQSILGMLDRDAADYLRQPVSWRGVQQLSEWYLASNVAWSVFFIAICTGLFSFRVADFANKRHGSIEAQQQATPPGSKSGV